MDMAPVRIQRKRAKGWRMPEGAVYVGRPTKWGNPFKVLPAVVCEACGFVELEAVTAEQALREYREFLERPQNLHGWTMPTRADIQRELRGKDLACWCRLDQPCHADVLLELANGDA